MHFSSRKSAIFRCQSQPRGATNRAPLSLWSAKDGVAGVGVWSERLDGEWWMKIGVRSREWANGEIGCGEREKWGMEEWRKWGLEGGQEEENEENEEQRDEECVHRWGESADSRSEEWVNRKKTSGERGKWGKEEKKIRFRRKTGGEERGEWGARPWEGVCKVQGERTAVSQSNIDIDRFYISLCKAWLAFQLHILSLLLSGHLSVHLVYLEEETREERGERWGRRKMKREEREKEEKDGKLEENEEVEEGITRGGRGENKWERRRGER